MSSNYSFFAELGFLSDQIQEFKASAQPQYKQDFCDLIEVCKISMSEIQTIPNGDIQYGHLVGHSFWWRCIENAQASIILADLGMATSAMSTARSSWENLFYAGALWNDPALIKNIYQKDKNQIEKQINEIQRVMSRELTEDLHIALSSMKPTENFSSSVLNVYEAAQKADLLHEYCVSYRGLSLIGAHSTAVSAFRALPESENIGHDFIIEPEFKLTRLILLNIYLCLTKGNHKFRELMESLSPQSEATPGQ